MTKKEDVFKKPQPPRRLFNDTRQLNKPAPESASTKKKVRTLKKHLIDMFIQVTQNKGSHQKKNHPYHFLCLDS